jgi:hypothetical protein
MRKITGILVLVFFALQASAQKIVPITFNGKKYEALDLTAKGKVTWGGYTEIDNNAAKSESNGASNTTAITAAVGKNENHDGKPYAARICSEAAAGGKDDWYLPSKEESDAIYSVKDKFNVEERGTIWTSTEASGTTAFTKYWYTGAFYTNQKVEEYHVVCIRKAD